MTGPLARRVPQTLTAVCLAVALSPAGAAAHGPAAPIATSYLARIGQLPAGVGIELLVIPSRMVGELGADDPGEGDECEDQDAVFWESRA
jgi:hypothetical protein